MRDTIIVESALARSWRERRAAGHHRPRSEIDRRYQLAQRAAAALRG